MFRILLFSLFLMSCSLTPVKSSITTHHNNFAIINTMCGHPVKVMFNINGVFDAQDIDPENKYSIMNLKTFLTIFKENEKYEAPLNKALMSVAKIRCDR